MLTIKVKVKLNERKEPQYEVKECIICGHCMGIIDYQAEKCTNCDTNYIIQETFNDTIGKN